MRGRSKGKRGELEVAKLVSKWLNMDLRRTPMSGAMRGYPGDIITASAENISSFPFLIEVKYREGWELTSLLHGRDGFFKEWIKQLEDETDRLRKPYSILFFRKNRIPWLIAIPEKQIKVELLDRYLKYHGYIVTTFKEVLQYEPRRILRGFKDTSSKNQNRDTSKNREEL